MVHLRTSGQMLVHLVRAKEEPGATTPVRDAFDVAVLGFGESLARVEVAERDDIDAIGSRVALGPGRQDVERPQLGGTLQ